MMRTSLSRTNRQGALTGVLRYATAFSAFGTLAGTSHAFSPCALPDAASPRTSQSSALMRRPVVTAAVGARPLASVGASSYLLRPASHVATQSRLLSNRRNYDYDPDEEKKEGFLDKVKSVLPTQWFKSDEEKRRDLVRKKAKDEITGGLSEVLKDAPLPVRMMGKVMGGMISNVASGLAEAAAEQSRRMEELMDDARRLIVADGIVADAIGEPVVIGAPFSQSSSTASINGKTTIRIQTSFEVMGSRQNGVATMTADDNGISQLSLNVGGRNYNVDTSGRPRPGGSGNTKISGRGSSGGKGEVIDAEIIDAEFKEK
mmetsp:Transcript_15197/g.44109  ORF Transcript_15197/g.44109 Transcript_15197/m.44109 type:complete len:317 (-) Transcript_15197:377-1327(-)